MNTEKKIKYEAKQTLKGNFSKIIASCGFICVCMMTLSFCASLILLYLKVISTSSNQIVHGKEWIYTTVFALFGVAVYFISPLINGVYRMFAQNSQSLNIQVSDMFYYFRNGAMLYFKTLCLNIILALVFVIVTYGLDTYVYTSYLLSGATLLNVDVFSLNYFILLASGIVSVIIKIAIYFLFVHFSLFSYAFDNSKKISYYIFTMLSFSIRNFGKTIKLFSGFIGWILLCFFVVPALYVFPYLFNSLATSAKWLFALDKDRGLLC